jgi:hypothetical protein
MTPAIIGLAVSGLAAIMRILSVTAIINIGRLLCLSGASSYQFIAKKTAGSRFMLIQLYLQQYQLRPLLYQL